METKLGLLADPTGVAVTAAIVVGGGVEVAVAVVGCGGTGGGGGAGVAATFGSF